MTSTQQRTGRLEVRSIDYVPLSERHGKIWHLGPLWFMSNAQIATLAVGLIGISEGGSLFWSVLAIVAGVLVGTLFMAFHSAQGPQLGLPQMIQSRPQFGYVGALLVWLFAYVQYAGFNVFNTILGGEAMSRTAHGSVKLWVIILTAVALVIALVGYDLIHRAERWLTVFMIVIFGIFTVTLFLIHYPAGTFDVGSFKASPFLGQFGVVAGYQISWAIYVSDYSRYLPPDVTVRKTFYWTYWGSAIGGAWMMIVGATLAAWAGKSFDGTGIAELDKVGDHVFTGFGAIVLILAAVGLVSVTALNMYGGSLTLISAVDSFKRVRPTLSARRHRSLHRRALAHRRTPGDPELPRQLQQLPAAGLVPVRAVDRGEPGRLLHRPPGPLCDRRDIQPPRHVRALGVARHPRLSHRLCRHGAVLQCGHPV
jgi:nucleobase:cation symporter-1, NCS1 family